MKYRIFTILALAGAVMGDSGCDQNSQDGGGRLDHLPKTDMSIKGQRFRLWVADNLADQNAGLMHVTKDQMAPLSDGVERGMLFVFDRSVRISFWMKNTIIPLDIAYLEADGTVITIYTMAPLDTRHNAYPPDAPYRFAIEVNAHRFAELGLKSGDRLEIPASVLKRPS